MAESRLMYNREPICPYCGNAEKDAWDIDFGDMEGEVENDCGKCGETYIITRNIEVTYTTSPISVTSRTGKEDK
jgi:hypothetical protein